MWWTDCAWQSDRVWIIVLGLQIHLNSPLPLPLHLLGFGFITSLLSYRVGVFSLHSLGAIVWSGSWNVSVLPSSATFVNLSTRTLSHPNISSPYGRDNFLLRFLAPRLHRCSLSVSRSFTIVEIRAVGLSLTAQHLNLQTRLRPEVLMDHLLDLINSIQMEYGLFLVLRLEVVSRSSLISTQPFD